MTITRQVYEWTLSGVEIGSDVTKIPFAGVPFSIFVGPFGRSGRMDSSTLTRNKTEIPPFVNEDQFVVIEDFSSTPGVLPDYLLDGTSVVRFSPNSFVQIVVDSTGYYQDPANIYDHGISGDASPYPWTGIDTEKRHYRLQPPLYILPLQTWDVRYTMMNDLRTAVEVGSLSVADSLTLARCFVQYTLYTGADAMIAQQLVKLGIPVTPDNVDWFKRQLLLSKGMDTQTFDYYLQLSQAFRDSNEKLQEHYGRGTVKEVHTDTGGDVL
jgi:hypothetical protein